MKFSLIFFFPSLSCCCVFFFSFPRNLFFFQNLLHLEKFLHFLDLGVCFSHLINNSLVVVELFVIFLFSKAERQGIQLKKRRREKEKNNKIKGARKSPARRQRQQLSAVARLRPPPVSSA